MAEIRAGFARVGLPVDSLADDEVVDGLLTYSRIAGGSQGEALDAADPADRFALALLNLMQIAGRLPNLRMTDLTQRDGPLN